MPIPICFIVGQLSIGGAEQQLYYLLSNLDRNRFLPWVASFGPRADEYWVGRIQELDIAVCHLPSSMGKPGRVFKLAALLRSRQTKIVHSWDLHTNPYAAVAAKLAKAPARIGSMRLNYASLQATPFVRWLGYKGLDIIVANSMVAAQQVTDLKLSRARVEYVPNGVQVTQAASPDERRHLRERFGFGDQHLIIGSIGRMDQNKNYQMLVRVFAALAEKWSQLRLLMIGDGPLRQELQMLLAQLGQEAKSNLPGIIPQAYRFLPVFDICCLTSYQEGMPNLVMEASMAGLPVVSTRCGGSSELIEHGQTGYLVDPDDKGQMIAAIDDLLAQAGKRVAMGQAGRIKMQQEFSISAMTEKMTQIYVRAAANWM